MEISNAKVVEISAPDMGGVIVRVCVPSLDSPGYYVNGIAEDAETEIVAFLRTLKLGDIIPLTGYPFPRYDKTRQRYELYLRLKKEES